MGEQNQVCTPPSCRDLGGHQLWAGPFKGHTENAQTKLIFYLMKTTKDNLPPSKSQAVKSQLVMEKEGAALSEEPYHKIKAFPVVRRQDG